MEYSRRPHIEPEIAQDNKWLKTLKIKGKRGLTCVSNRIIIKKKKKTCLEKGGRRGW